MYLTCLSKTIIRPNSNVRLMIISDHSVYSNDLLLSTYSSKDHYRIMGVPIEGVTNQYGMVQVDQTSSAALLTLAMLKNECLNFEQVEEASDKFEAIQELISDGKLIARGHKRRGFFQISIIDENVYQMCKETEHRDFDGNNLDDSYSSFYKRIQPYITEPIQTPKIILDIIKAEPNVNEHKDLKYSLMPRFGFLGLSEESMKFYYLFQHNTLEYSATYKLTKELYEAKYVLRLLAANGNYLSPTKVINDSTEQSSFTKMLLEEQKAEVFCEDGEDIVIKNTEYEVDLSTLKKEIMECWDEEYALEVIDEIEEAIIEEPFLYAERETECDYQVIFDFFPKYIKIIKITKGDL